MTTTETLKLALEALKRMKGYGNTFAYRSHEQDPHEQVCDAITALEALASEAIEQKSGIKQVIELYDSPDQPAQQEPVAWLVDNGGDSILIRHSQNFPGVFVGSEFNKRPLVFGDTSPPAQRKPLTDEEIVQIEFGLRQYNNRDTYDLSLKDFARAIEAAHGIKGDA